jgi:hypothetical protein
LEASERVKQEKRFVRGALGTTLPGLDAGKGVENLLVPVLAVWGGHTIIMAAAVRFNDSEEIVGRCQ